MTFRYVFAAAVACAASACGGSPESTGRSEAEPVLRGEISRAEAVADAETARIAIDTPEVRRELVENAWSFDEDVLEIECWGVGVNQVIYYTARLRGGRRIGSPMAFASADQLFGTDGMVSVGSDGVFRVPDQGPSGVGPVDGVLVELPDVVQDDRLDGLGGRGRADMLARRVCGG